MIFDTIQNPSQLSSYRPAWEQLAIQSPYQSFDWIRNWAQGIHSESLEICFIVGRDEAGKWTGVAPFYREIGLSRRLRMAQPANSYHSNGFLCAAGFERRFIDELLEWLLQSDRARQLIGNIDAIVFDRVCRQDPLVSYVLNSFANANYQCHFANPQNQWTIPFAATFEEFIGRQSSTLAESCSVWMEFVDHQIVTRSSRDEGAVSMWADFEKMRVGIEPSFNDAFADDRFAQCLKRSVFALCDQQSAEIRVNYLADHPVSASILFDFKSQRYMCEQAFSPFASLEDIALWTELEIIRDSLSRGFQSLDLPPSPEETQCLWTSEAAPLEEVRIVSPSLLSKIKYGLAASGEALFGSFSQTV